MGLLMMPVYVVIRYCWLMYCHIIIIERVIVTVDRWHGMLMEVETMALAVML